MNEENIMIARWGFAALLIFSSLMMAVLMCWLHEHDLHLFEPILKFLRRPVGEVLIVLVCVGGLVQHGATKGFFGGPRMMAPREMQTELVSAPESVDAVAGMFSSYTNAVTNVCATGIMPGETSVFLRAHWPWNLYPAPTGIEVYAAPQLTTNQWVGVGTAPIIGSDSSAVIELPHSLLPDGWESSMFFMFGLNIDTDQDGLSDAFERIVTKTDPNLADTDGDGMSDGWEAEHGFDPTTDNAEDDDPDNDRDGDPDEDGLTNGQEVDFGTDPFIADSDGDGISDGAEVAQASDPADASDGGVARSRVPVTFTFGDQSGSHSEKYRLELTPVQTAGADGSPRSFTWTDAQYGVCETKTALLMRGCSYELRMFHAGTREGDESDYDYSLSVSYPQGAGVIVSDPSELIRADDQTSAYFSGEGKVVTIKVLNPSLVFCKPEDGDWSELEESRVVLDNEKLKIKISVSPKLETKAQCIAALGGSLMLRTSGTCPSGVVVPLDSDAEWDAGGTGFSAIKITKTMTQLKALGLLPSQNGDGVAEKATLDMGAGDIASDSNLSDSREFLGLGAEFRGDANNGIEGDLTSQPPVSLPSESFFKAAGSEVIYAEYAGAVAEPKQVMNQADYF